MTPTLPTSCGSLPPEGAAAPAVRRSRSCGPCLGRLPPRSRTSCSFLPPRGPLRLRPLLGKAGNTGRCAVRIYPARAAFTAAVKAIVAELGASGPGDMGKVMGAVKAKLAGKADMGQVSAAVKAALAG